MSSITFVSPTEERTSVSIKPGTTVMEAAIANGVSGIEAQCYGAGVCGTCHVYVPADLLASLPAPSAWESGMLEGLSLVGPGSRLSCQIQFEDSFAGAEFQLPDRQEAI